MQSRIGHCAYAPHANLAGGRVKQGQQPGGPTAFLSMRLQNRVPSGCHEATGYPPAWDGGSGFLFRRTTGRFPPLQPARRRPRSVLFFPASPGQRSSPCYLGDCARQSRYALRSVSVESGSRTRGAPRATRSPCGPAGAERRPGSRRAASR